MPTLELIQTNEREVLTIINSLDANKSTGPDEIPVKLLKLCAILIALPLSKLFNKSLRQGIYPESFKLANIHPIYKNKGSPSDITNYRPINILAAISKIFEKIVHKHIYSHLTDNEMLNDKQSGYRKGHSTEKQLLYLTHHLYKSLDSGQDFTAVYLDISKYFDKIWHEGLLYKCKNDFGITDSLLKWLTSYLSDRKHRVLLGDCYSTTLTINTGCPQGSVLGPLLALMYLDGLSKETTNDMLLFADDTSIYAKHTTQNITEVEASLQKDLNTIYDYGQRWAITFNASKTVQQTFSFSKNKSAPKLKFGGNSIPIKILHTHLGLTFSNDLNFHEHVNKICKKANMMLGPLYSISRYVPRSILSKIYLTYIRPFFDYCDTVYDGQITKRDSDRLEKLQNRACRLVTGALFRSSTSKLREDTGWESLKDRRQIHKLILYKKLMLVNYNEPRYIKSLLPQIRQNETGRVLRNANAHSTPQTRKTSFKNSFFPSVIQKWNEIPEAVQQQSNKSFKKVINEKMGVSRPPKFYSFCTKNGNINHSRLRIGHTKLNSHLFLIQKRESPECSCGNATESIRHYMLHCPKYTALREALYVEISEILREDFWQVHPSSKIETLLFGTNTNENEGRLVAESFQNFILKTKRFTGL